ncbi:MAG: type I glyceraldehyde-3-phosphate dehydrogenase [SAR116 cluster bacterium]|nr:type I glyceraldehyde-3-phosphate dehydrogenase [SAR116 cluster bacterium]RPH07767.1 MAG: type I glyceraldehyde-3-phosphate dehydrogenase [Alphaproteobacteria bacterium TMED54]
MLVKVAINGFGRIGRNILRSIIENNNDTIKVVGINDLGPIETNAHLLKYDSVHGILNRDIIINGSDLDVGKGPIKVTSERNPENLPWKELNVDVVLECTGIFTSKEKAQQHITAGAKKVLISAPASGVDLTVVYGVNHKKISSEHQILSNASCTTNCLAPLAYVLNKSIGIENGFMTTIHSYTGDQPALDTMHSDLYRARAAASNMIPTSTGAAKAVGLVLPELDGKLDGVAIRVPTQNVSVVDFKFNAKKETTIEQINEAIKIASENELKNVLSFNDKKLVSSDFNHNPSSSIFHSDQTKVMNKKFVRILSWYDNEWGFSNRMCDTTLEIGKYI